MSCDPLNAEERVKVYAAYLQHNTAERKAMYSLISPVIKSFGRRPIQLMSIGPGDGSFEDGLIKNYEMSLSYFHAIEPSKKEVTKLQKVIEEWNVKNKIEEIHFTPDFSTTEKFDLILMAQVMYHIPSPAGVVSRARSFLKPNGKLLIIHQTEESMCTIHRNFLSMASYALKPVSDPSVSTQVLSDILTKNDISHYITEEAGYLDVSDFIAKRKKSSANHIVTLMIQTWYERLPISFQNVIYNMVKAECVTPEPHKYLFPQHAGMITIESDK